MCKIPEICAISISHPFRKSLAAPALIKLKAGGLTACSGQHNGSSLNTEVSHYNSQVHKCTSAQIQLHNTSGCKIVQKLVSSQQAVRITLKIVLTELGSSSN